MKNITIQRFPKGHKFYSDVTIMHDGKGYQATFGQCVETHTNKFLNYTMERRDTLIAEGEYEYGYYDSPGNHCKVVLLLTDPNGKNISERKLEHHIANWPYELDGCTAHGSLINVGVPMIGQSGIAFNKLMKYLNGEIGTVTYETLKS